MKLHEFLNDDVACVTVFNENEYRRKNTYTMYDGPHGKEKCDFSEITKGMEGTILYYDWYAGGLAERMGFISVDEDGNITEDRCVGIS